jgi:uncharacterized protein YaaN involved in tellurite resistance
MSEDAVARTRISAIEQRTQNLEEQISDIRATQLRQLERSNYVLMLLVISLITTTINLIVLLSK